MLKFVSKVLTQNPLNSEDPLNSQGLNPQGMHLVCILNSLRWHEQAGSSAWGLTCVVVRKLLLVVMTRASYAKCIWSQCKASPHVTANIRMHYFQCQYQCYCQYPNACYYSCKIDSVFRIQLSDVLHSFSSVSIHLLGKSICHGPTSTDLYEQACIRREAPYICIWCNTRLTTRIKETYSICIPHTKQPWR